MSSRSKAADVRTPWLVADIGGTNARFGLAHRHDGAVASVVWLRCADFASPLDAVHEYLRSVSVPPPRSAAFALAAVVGADHVRMTNGRQWLFSRKELRNAFDFERVVFLNDFAALALSLPALRSDDYIIQFGPRPPATAANPMAVIGPGTGLGVGAVVPHRGRWIPVAGEGGHATVSAATPFEAEVLSAARHEFEHVSAERLLSGTGLPVLYRAVAAVRGQAAAQLRAEEITALDAAGDGCAAATIDVLCAMLGTFAGNVALTFGARGGVFLAGGVVRALGERIARSEFRRRFESKGRFAPYLRSIATPAICANDAALRGVAYAVSAIR